jgi:hypothetical protein
MSSLGLAAMRRQGFDIETYRNISDDEKFRIIRESDILLFPTEFEGFGIPPAEALYVGTAAFVYDIPVLREVYGEYPGVKFVKCADVKGMVQALNEEYNTRTVTKEARANEGQDYKPCSLKRFKDDTLNTFGIPRVTAGVIVYNGADYIQYAMSSVSNVVDQFIVVDGAVRGYIPNGEDGKSTDGTIKLVQATAKKDIFNRIQLVTLPDGKGVWEDKMEMQNEIAKRITGEYYLKLDSDEIWKSGTLVDAIRKMKREAIDILRVPFYHFWLSFNNIAVDEGHKWSTAPPRIWRWAKGFKHTVSFNYFVDALGKKVQAPNYKVSEYSGDRIYHFGYVRRLNVLQNKIHYYKNRGIEKVAKDTVTDYKEGGPTQPTQDKPSTAVPFSGKLPSILDQHPYRNIHDIRNLE